ncbi:MAG: threonine ammonia-lyase [Nitrospira sp.]|nr:threonine ammonia-lyase [Nitrospira sp.]
MVNLQTIEAAGARIRHSIYESPLMHSKTLSRLTGNSIFLKLENLQMTGSFKERGALNRILTLTDDEQRRGVVAASAGNHGQGVAYHGTQRHIPVQIWMPRSTPLIKLSATRKYGAEVILHGTSYDEACEAAVDHSITSKATFIHPFDDDAVIAGQGTIGLELLAQNPKLDVIVVPVGGGGLIGGVACAVKSRNTHVEVIGVQTARLPSMRMALQGEGSVGLPTQSTLADGIAVRRAGMRTLPLVRRYVDDIVTVDEDDIAAAILLLLESEKTVAEGAGAIALAAVLQSSLGHRGKHIAVLVSGGNVDVNLLARIIEQGLVRDGRRLRVRLRLLDYPGALEGLAAMIAKAHANIVETSYNRAHYGVKLNEAAIDITMETRGRAHADELVASLREAGYEFSVVE